MKYRVMYYKDQGMRVLEQGRLPSLINYADCQTHYDIFSAIKNRNIVGRMPIGIASAYGMALASDCLTKDDGSEVDDWKSFMVELSGAGDFINLSPNANVSSFIRGVINHAKSISRDTSFDLKFIRACLFRYADKLAAEECQANIAIGEYGCKLVRPGCQVLLHGGHLSTFEYAPALAPLYTASKKGVEFNVYVAESRPHLNGTRLTAWELQQTDNMNPTVVPDQVVPWLMKTGRVDLVIVQAERVAANGDVLAESGTYGLAVACKSHNIPFYVCASLGSIDLTFVAGDEFNLGLVDPNDVITSGNMRDVSVFGTLMDVTDHQLITGIITDKGIISPVSSQAVERCFAF